MQNRGNTLCPYCEQVTPVADLRAAGRSGGIGEQMVAVITEDKGGKRYRPVEDSDLEAFRGAAAIPAERPQELILPEVNAEDVDDNVSNSTGIRVHLYGMKTWGSLFNPRQLVAMQTFVACLHEALDAMKKEIEDSDYRKALAVYLGIVIDRLAQRGSNVGVWHTGQETFEHPFGRQAIPMTWDYPEANPFASFTQKAIGTDYVSKVVVRESRSGLPATIARGDGAGLLLERGISDVVVTDPPYFDAIAYGDLSDYFYVWLKRGLGDVIPEALATPLTPKTDEATALKHRHEGDAEKADAHFKSKLAAVLAEAHRILKPGGVISIMFAHQSTKAWTALVSAIFEAGLTVDATWPIDTEKTYALKTGKSVLASSITVTCRARIMGSAAAFMA
jgi:adenine-specific DNA methylase